MGGIESAQTPAKSGWVRLTNFLRGLSVENTANLKVRLDPLLVRQLDFTLQYIGGVHTKKFTDVCRFGFR